MIQNQSRVATTRLDILGVPVDAVNMEAALERVREMLSATGTNVIAAVNPEKVIAAQNVPALLNALERADLLIPDGIGVVMAARILEGAKMNRVPGSDLMPAICEVSSDLNKSVFLFGAKQEIVEKTAKILHERFPNLVIAGISHGFVQENQMGELITKINKSGAAVLFVGTGSPRQELWMDRFRDALNVRICQGVGGTFDALCGHTKRAPILAQRLHLEWLYRLVTQPKRAGRQRALPKFLMQVFSQYLLGR